MSSRNTIRQAQAIKLPIPEPALGIGGKIKSTLTHFIAMLDFIGPVSCVLRGSKNPRRGCAKTFPWMRRSPPRVAALPGNVDLSAVVDQHDLKGTQTVIFPARFAVCENAAAWVKESELGHRALLMIAEHLFIVVKADQGAAEMHAAYARIGKIGSGFGLFLTGPSKTAEIEQCLVIGAN